jgi:hypothetical protein
MNNHDKAVLEFLEKCKTEQPDKYQEVCDRYPTISARQWKKIHEREESRGLLGLQPAYISPETAETYGFESVYEEE